MSADPPTPSVPGLSCFPSAHSVAETVRRLEELLASKGIRIFAKIDHAAGAREAGLPLRPTMLLVFGNPSAGTPLMQSGQTIGIDLPLKGLVWEDEAGKTWLGYNRPAFLAERHGIPDRSALVQTMSAGLEAMARAATAP